jgi:hypothetical protein
MMHGDKPNLEDWSDLLESDEDFAEEFNKICNDTNVPEADDDFDPDSFDACLNMESAIDRGGDDPEFARVTKCMKDDKGNPVGVAHDNPIMDSRMCEVEFLDGQMQAASHGSQHHS